MLQTSLANASKKREEGKIHKWEQRVQSRCSASHGQTDRHTDRQEKRNAKHVKVLHQNVKTGGGAGESLFRTFFLAEETAAAASRRRLGNPRAAVEEQSWIETATAAAAAAAATGQPYNSTVSNKNASEWGS